MRFAGWSVLIYAVLVALGGVIGYICAHSTTSLFASIPFSIALLLCTPGLFRSKRPAFFVSLILVLILDAFFTYRFSISLLWMPSGMMMVISLITLSSLVYGIRKIGSAASSRNSS